MVLKASKGIGFKRVARNWSMLMTKAAPKAAQASSKRNEKAFALFWEAK